VSVVHSYPHPRLPLPIWRDNARAARVPAFPILASGFRSSVLTHPTSFQLAGRILLIFLFIGFVFQGSWSFARVLVSIVGLGACIMVAVGFKAKYSASFLVLLLSIFNVFINNWWSVHTAHPQRDFLKYDL
jgi:uncharacterized membrane protein YphA (DoxX/SURF4 family)